MAIYTVPTDVREKERVIGGVFNMNQFFWLLGGFGIGITLFVLSFSLFSNLPISIFLALVGMSLSLPFVFYKRGDLTLFQYLVRKRAFNKKTHRLINKRVVK